MTSSKAKPARSPIRVMVIDDHPTVREGLGHRINSQHNMELCGEAADCQEALDQIRENDPDVVILDIALKDQNGLDLIKAFFAKKIAVRVIVHSMYDESVYAIRSMRAGALGYVNKESNPDEVIDAIRAVVAGDVYFSTAVVAKLVGQRGQEGVDPIATLTDRQLEVFRLIGNGKTAAQIAASLHISVHTVETHRDNIKHKLNVANLNELTRLAVLWGSHEG